MINGKETNLTGEDSSQAFIMYERWSQVVLRRPAPSLWFAERVSPSNILKDKPVEATEMRETQEAISR